MALAERYEEDFNQGETLDPEDPATKVQLDSLTRNLRQAVLDPKSTLTLEKALTHMVQKPKAAPAPSNEIPKYLEGCVAEYGEQEVRRWLTSHL